MSCHVAAERAERAAATPVLRLRARPLKIVLVGNPNVGKSVIFGRLTGRYATVSNYPGTTVGLTSGRALVGAEVCDIVDSPGVNALEGVLSEDEHVTRRLLANRRGRRRRPGGRRAQPAPGPDADRPDRRVRPSRWCSCSTWWTRRAAAAWRWTPPASRPNWACRSSRRSRSKGRAWTTSRTRCRTRRPRACRSRPASTTRPGRTRPPGGFVAPGRRRSAGSRNCSRGPSGGLPPACPSSRSVLYLVYLFVGVFGAQTLVSLDRARPVPRLHQPGRDAPRRPVHSVGPRSRLPGRPLRPHHHGADLRDRHRAAGGGHVLPGLRLARGQRLHSAPRHLRGPHLPGHGAERQGRAADGARPRLRHDGDDDDANPRDAEGAADRRAPARARHPVLGAARHDPRHPRRHLVLRRC